jgi:hypothetical protein
MWKIAARMLPCVIGASLGACGGGDPADGTPPPVGRADMWVYESRLSVQCGSHGLTTQQSAQKLINGGIDVVRSACGVITGVAYPALCGTTNGEIIIHEVRRVNLPDAERLGFRSADSLRDPATDRDYAKVDCQTGALVP